MAKKSTKSKKKKVKKARQESELSRILKRYFFTGVLALLPILITFFILKYFFDLFKNNIFQYLPKIISTVPALNYILYFVFLIILVLFTGVITVELFETRWKHRIDDAIQRIPGFSAIFNPFKQLTENFLSKKKNKYKRVVIIEYPTRDTYAIAFVTRENIKMGSKKVVSVVVPTTPVPASGYMLYVPVNKVYEINMSVEDAVKTIISGGFIQMEKIISKEMAKKKKKRKKKSKKKSKKKKSK